MTVNADSVWSGPMEDRLSKTALRAMPEVQQALLANSVSAAANLALANLAGNPVTSRQYQYVSDIKLDFGGHCNISNYRRFLDLQNGTVHVDYDVGNTTYERTWFASYESQTIVGHITSSNAGQISLDLGFSRTGLSDGHRVGTVFGDGEDSIVLSAAASSAGPPHYVARLTVKTATGTIFNKARTNVVMRHQH